ncbi:MAG: RNA polymerase sigma factor [Bacteroidota bacterium]
MKHKKSDKKEFADLLEQNIGIIHKVSRLYTNNPVDKEDLFQDICFQLWRSYGSYREEAQLSTWMYRVAINTAVSQIRKRKNIVIPVEEFQEQQDDRDNSEKEEQIQLLYKAISLLNKIDKAIIMLWLEEKKYEEIAGILGISTSNVSVKLFRIRQRLSEKMKGLEI